MEPIDPGILVVIIVAGLLAIILLVRSLRANQKWTKECVERFTEAIYDQGHSDAGKGNERVALFSADDSQHKYFSSEDIASLNRAYFAGYDAFNAGKRSIAQIRDEQLVILDQAIKSLTGRSRQYSKQLELDF